MHEQAHFFLLSLKAWMIGRSPLLKKQLPKHLSCRVQAPVHTQTVSGGALYSLPLEENALIACTGSLRKSV